MRQPVVRVPLGGWVSPEELVRELGDAGDLVWIDAGVDADARGAAPRPGHPTRSLVGWGTRSVVADARRVGAVEAALRLVDASLRDVEPGSDPLGWWGVIGYGVSAELLAPGDREWAERLADDVHDDLALLEVDLAVEFDHTGGTASLVGRRGEDERIEAVRVAWAAISGRPAADPAAPPIRVELPVLPADEDPGYLAKIAACQAAIARGDAFVLCLTTRLTVETDERDLDLYSRLRRASPAPRALFVRIGRMALLGASPETFVRVDPDRRVSSAPIKGTRARAADPAVDSAVAASLRADEKERAENLMIVDLMRNDLSRVSAPGEVAVERLFAVESYEHVHQLVSEVTGRLRPGLTGVDVLRATFPPGSMTGAPKHSVVGILSALEAGPRGPYSGVAGRFGFEGTVDLAVVIRSIVLDRATGSASVGVGGGITDLSVPTDELAEVATKAAASLAVLGARAPVENGPRSAPESVG